jgi:PAS domain-containing protein
VLGEAWVHIVHPDDVERVVWLWTRALDEGIPWEATPRVRHADGTYHLWFTRAERVRDEQATFWIGTTIELTEPVRSAIRNATEGADAAGAPAHSAGPSS